LFSILLFVPNIALGYGGFAQATSHVYVYDVPEISVSLTETKDGLICSWDILDNDKEDTFHASVYWAKDGEPFKTEELDCGSLRKCTARERPQPVPGETWVCSVTVRDSFGAEGTGTAQFYKAPLGFLSGLIQKLLAIFGLA